VLLTVENLSTMIIIKLRFSHYKVNVERLAQGRTINLPTAPTRSKHSHIRPNGLVNKQHQKGKL
ncbi:MAG: hypothetical protein RR405_02530, partial [Clostridia bacterium]